MYRKLVSLLIVLLVATTCVNIYLPSQANALTAQSQVNQISAEQTEEFRKLLIDYYAAWSIPENKPWDITTAQNFYQINDRMFGFDFMPPAEGFQGWEAYKAELTKIMSGFSRFTVTLGNRFLVYRNGNVIWTVSTFNINGALKNGTPIKNSGRNTLIWERVGNQWLIAHEHVSTPFSSKDN